VVNTCFGKQGGCGIDMRSAPFYLGVGFLFF